MMLVVALDSSGVETNMRKTHSIVLPPVGHFVVFILEVHVEKGP
jgi:hypothetical protein